MNAVFYVGVVVMMALGLPAATAQETQSADLVAYIMAPAVPNPFTGTSPLSRGELSDLQLQSLQRTGCLSPTHNDPRERFMAEFGFPREHLSSIRRPIADAKYAVDVTVFAVCDALRTFEGALELELRRGSWVRRSSRAGTRLKHDRRNASLRADIAWLRGSPYIGVRLELPIGN